MSRICPRCHQEIASSQLCFCFSCGQELPELDDDNHSEEALRSGGGRRRWPVVVSLGATLFLGSLGAGLWWTRSRSPSLVQPEVEGVAEKQPVVVTVALPLPSAAFGQDRLGHQIPVGVDFYWESSQPEKLTSFFLPSVWGENFSQGFGLPLDEAASFLSSAYALAGWEGNQWVFLAKLKGKEFVLEKLTDWPEGLWPGWQAQVWGDYLLVTNAPEKVADLEKVASGELPSLEASTLLGLRSSLPAAGQALVFLSAEEGLALAQSFFPGASSEPFAEAFRLLKGPLFVLSSQKDQTLVEGGT